MFIIASIVNPLIGFWVFILIVSVIASWLLAFGVINPRNQFVAMVLQICQSLTEPVLKPIRQVIPPIGGIDLTPIIAIILARAIQGGLNHYVFGPAINAGL